MLDSHTLDVIFRKARTYNRWQDRNVDISLLKQAWDLSVLGPTSANCQPMRIIFLTTPQANERLKPCLNNKNIEKTILAPITAIIAHDIKFYDKLPELFPHTNAREWFIGNDKLIIETCIRNATLQAGYFILALRALGLDCGQMSGFSNEKVDNEFFHNTAIKSNFLINIGYGDPSSLFPRNHRITFDTGTEII